MTAEDEEKDERYDEENVGEDGRANLRVLCFTTLGIVYFTLDM